MPNAPPAVAVISPIHITSQLSGPGLRYRAFAETLSRQQRVTLVTPNADAPAIPGVDACWIDDHARLSAVIATHGVVIVQGYSLLIQHGLRGLIEQHRPFLAVDLYTPLNIEGLNLRDPDEPRVEEELGFDLHALRDQLGRGDFFFCANDRQRDYYLGLLAGLGRVNLKASQHDPALRALIDLVPFGLETNPPQPGPRLLRGVHPAVPADSQILLWFGGLWNWLDPEALVRAFAQLTETHPRARLVFVAEQPAKPDAFYARTHRATQELSETLGLRDKQVIFHVPIPSAQRGQLMLEADIGLCFNRDSLETRFAYRTRIIDYIWAGLPLLVGSGDDLGDTVSAHGLGHAVAPGDDAALTRAMAALLSEPNARDARAANFAAFHERMRWPAVMAPLTTFCAAPWRAIDGGHAAAGAPEAPAIAKLASQNVELDLLHRENAHLRNLLTAMNNGRVMRVLNAFERLKRRNAAPKKP